MPTQPPRPKTCVSRRRLLGAAGALALAPLAARGSAKTAAPERVTIAPDFYTLAEIAPRLSRAGDKVRCAPALRGRAVLLSLEDRPLTDARQVLCDTLGLTLTPLENSLFQWSLDPDPAITQRETRWRDAYADHATAALTAYLARVAAQVGSRKYTEWQAEYQAMGTSWPDFAKQTAPETGEKLSATQVAKARRDWYRKRIFIDALREPGFWLAYRRLQKRPPDLRRVIRNSTRSTTSGENVRLTAFSPQSSVDGIPAERFAGTVFGERHDTLAERTTFDPLRQCFVFQTGTLFYAEASCSHTFDFPCGAQSVEDLFAFLGDDATAYFARSQERTEAFFRLPLLKQAVPLPEGDGASLSASLLAWCRATGGEIVAEVQPLRDRFSVPADTTRLRLAEHTPRATQARANAEQARIRASGWFDKEVFDSLKDTADDTWPLPPSLLPGSRETPNDLTCWDFDLRDDNILRVSDRLAFLDRAQDLPMDFPLALWRRRETRRADPTAPETLPEAPFTWNELYTLLLSPASWDTTGWVRLGLATHWGFPIGRLAKVVPFLHLLADAGLGASGPVWEALEARGHLVIPVAACGPDAGGRIADALRRQGFWCANAYHARFAAFAQTCHFVLSRGKTSVPDYGDEPPPPGTPRVAANLLSVDLHDLTLLGTRSEWEPDDPDLEGYWILPRDLPNLEWSG